MQADRLQAFKRQMEGIASGSVRLVNSAENMTLTSDRLRYRDEFEYVELSGGPRLVKLDGDGVTTTAEAKRMEFFQKEERGRFVGDVEIVQGELVVNCQEAVYYNGEDKIVLNGEPYARQEDSYFTGKKMILFVDEDRLQIEGDVSGKLYPEDESEE